MKHVFRLMSCMQCHCRECNNIPLAENDDWNWVGSIQPIEKTKGSLLFHPIDLVRAPKTSQIGRIQNDLKFFIKGKGCQLLFGINIEI